ncbi:putative intermembrane space import and assembly protein 40, mitochondrial precursor [Triangularia verruculosa]|uniref:Mitochondrial intermembrane space import and assembly protein 40 n=1 Tax=Triangularia verruculosa TaxID=2587418 RepID=A0AAN6XD86_9PEZI|nr:putative intermembrane space import and assembly protein 40, mitochondrial precursor [Triangularia verruculosa]
MYRSARCALRAIRPAPTTASSLVTAPTRRFASTTTAGTKKTGTWKGTVVRWGLAGAALYYYNTSPVFADELPQPQTPPVEFSESDLPTIDALIEEKRRHVPPPPPPQATKAAVDAVNEQIGEREEEFKPATTEFEPGSPEALEQEASQQGAFNPETGEINWDCPCLGGMAHGPCGEEFKEAFSCFVYSKEEPKGIECIDKFQGMQTCFRQYPEIYGTDMTGGDDDDDETVVAPEGTEVATKAPESDAKEAEQAEKDEKVQKLVEDIKAEKKKQAEEKKEAEGQVEEKKEAEKPVEEKEEELLSGLPKEAADATDANHKKQ